MGLGSGAVCDIRLNTALSPEQRERFQNGRAITNLLGTARTIAVVGMSSEKTKASNMVGSYLQDEGYRVIPVNPRCESVLGERCYPDLDTVPEPIDLVVVFRPVSEVPGIVDQAIKVGAKAVWMQLRIVDLPSAEKALKAGLIAVVDRCVKMEHGRYSGALHWAGMNTEIVSARRRNR